MLAIKKLLLTTLFIVGLIMASFTAPAQNKTYIANHKAIAVVLSHQYGIPSALILAVAAIESSGGRGPAARVLNNHFGIEGKNDYVNKNGRKSRYKQYSNVFSSYVDFCKLLTRKRFYQKLKDNPDCVAWVKAMSRAHYSEVPEEWEQKIFSMLVAMKAIPKIKTSDEVAAK